jgi:hypothetical protein
VNFIIIEINDGGAEATDSDRSGVVNHLNSWFGWLSYRDRFVAHAWQPGEWMAYPNGWIFCVGREV